jgi:hypothetical protein
MRNLGVENFKMKLIELFPSKSKSELERREYHIMQRYIKKGRQLFNTTIEYGKQSNETKLKISIATKGRIGEQNNSFKRGSLYRNVTPTGFVWVFKWMDNGKRKTNSFSVQKYGEKEARRQAEKVQKKIFPLRNK